jgi:uncharacterized protein with PIN domain
MLLRLGRWLRLLGQDVANPDGQDDRKLLQRARDENRTLITRDKGLSEACSMSNTRCIFIKSSRLEDQLKEMERLGVRLNLNPAVCTICNSPLCGMDNEMWMCEGCGKLYWRGSHWRHIEEMLKQLRSDESDR